MHDENGGYYFYFLVVAIWLHSISIWWEPEWDFQKISTEIDEYQQLAFLDGLKVTLSHGMHVWTHGLLAAIFFQVMLLTRLFLACIPLQNRFTHKSARDVAVRQLRSFGDSERIATGRKPRIQYNSRLFAWSCLGLWSRELLRQNGWAFIHR